MTLGMDVQENSAEGMIVILTAGSMFVHPGTSFVLSV